MRSTLQGADHLRFVQASWPPANNKYPLATFAAGCFWGLAFWPLLWDMPEERRIIPHMSRSAFLPVRCVARGYAEASNQCNLMHTKILSNACYCMLINAIIVHFDCIMWCGMPCFSHSFSTGGTVNHLPVLCLITPLCQVGVAHALRTWCAGLFRIYWSC